MLTEPYAAAGSPSTFNNAVPTKATTKTRKRNSWLSSCLRVFVVAFRSRPIESTRRAAPARGRTGRPFGPGHEAAAHSVHAGERLHDLVGFVLVSHEQAVASGFKRLDIP